MAGPRQVKLVSRGEPRFCVQVMPPQDAEALLEPISELTTHVETAVGRKVTWFDRWAESLPPVRLVLRFDPDRDLHHDAFEIRATATSVTLTAATVPGVSHAVHHFLEQAFGIRWLWPGKSGIVVPKKANVSWPLGTRRLEPDWFWRRLWFGGAFWKEDDPTLAEMKIGGASPEALRELDAWQARNRLGGLQVADGHRWAQICSPLVYGRKDPEYFALVDGKRMVRYIDGKHGNQPCTSNPDVIDLTARHIMAQFARRPSLDGFSFAVNDGLGFCECDGCRAIDEWAKAGAHDEAELDRATDESTEGFHAQKGSISDRMLLFANQVAERVEKVYPGKLLLVLIYSQYRNPPKRVKLHDNVIAQFCTASHSHWKDQTFHSEMGTLRGVCRFTARQGIYDYFINGTNGTFPRGFARTFDRSLKAYHRCGCRYFASQASLDFATNGFAYYAAARLLWDTGQDVDDILGDFCRSGFGPAHRVVRRYVSAFLKRWEAVAPKPTAVEELAGVLYPEAWRRARRGELTEAARLCAGEPEELARVRFLRAGLRFLDLFCSACSAMIDLVDAGAPRDRPVDEPALARWVRGSGEKKAVARAVKARRQLLRWVDAHRDGFWIAPMWFDYQRLCRGGLLGRWIDVVERTSAE